jgi:hypothetical protein
MVVKIEKSSRAGKCLVCQRGLGFFRRLAKNCFCTDEHEQQYLAELKEVALGRLRVAASRLARHNEAHV